MSVDVQEGSTVVFDSYEKEDGTRKTEYGRYGPEYARGPNEEAGYEYVINYFFFYLPSQNFNRYEVLFLAFHLV